MPMYLMYNKILFALFFIGLLLVSSCGDDEGTDLIFSAPNCTRGWAYCGKSAMVGDSEGYMYETKTTLNTGDTVSINKVLLGFVTNDAVLEDKGLVSSSWREMYEAGELDSCFVSYVLRVHGPSIRDEEIEHNLEAYYLGTRTNIITIDYRTTPIKDMLIFSNVDICGRKAGESLNDLFIIMGYNDAYYPYIITADKRLITNKNDILDIPVEKYLSYHPMAPVRINMRISDIATIENETKARFFVTLTTDDDRVIRMQTHEVVLRSRG